VRLTFLIVWLLLLSFLTAQPAQDGTSQCLAFVDYDFIWTLELVKEQDGTTPIFNAICLSRGQWELEPGEIRLYLGKDELRATDFSIDSGDPANPRLTKYLGIRGPDFVGVDLVGDFKKLDVLTKVVIELGKDRFILDPLDCSDYDALLDKLSQLELDSSSQVDRFEALGIKLFGRRQAR
jgi:hypothetical protein